MMEWLADYPRLPILVGFISLNWIGAVVLFRAHRSNPRTLTLKDAAHKAIALAAASTIGIYVWLELRLDFPLFPREAVLWIIFFTLVGVSIPTLVFLYKYFKGEFGRD